MVNTNVTQTTSDTQRFWALDVFRGIAILAVIGFHVLPPAIEADSTIAHVGWLQYGGILGVSGFFCLSGFSIHLSQLRKQDADAQKRVDWVAFFIQRFWRLYPSYVGAIACAITLNLLWALLKQQNLLQSLPSILDILSHLLLMQTFSPDSVFGILPALWFVGVLAHLYGLYPVFAALVQRFNCDRALLIVLGVTLICRYLTLSIPTPSPNLGVTTWHTALHHWFEWCWGAWVAERFYRGSRFNSPIGFGVLLTLIWAGIGSTYKLIYEPVLGVLVGNLIWNFSRLSVKPAPIWQPLIALGQISYSVYLLHQLFIPYLKSALNPNPWSTATNVGLLFTLVLIVSVPLAKIYHQIFEKLPPKLVLAP